jgi:hypothetical protein
VERPDHRIGVYGAEGSVALGESLAFFVRFVDDMVVRCGLYQMTRLRGGSR